MNFIVRHSYMFGSFGSCALHSRLLPMKMVCDLFVGSHYIRRIQKVTLQVDSHIPALSKISLCKYHTLTSFAIHTFIHLLIPLGLYLALLEVNIAGSTSLNLVRYTLHVFAQVWVFIFMATKNLTKHICAYDSVRLG